jgi:hypothetical protein
LPLAVNQLTPSMEQESIFQEIPTEKLYKPKSIYLATFFGGPLVAGYMISSNYRALNEKQNVAKTWVFTILGSILILILSYVINYRSTRPIPGFLFPLIYSIITYSVVNLAQKEKIAAYISEGGKFHPSSRIITVTIFGIIISVFGLLIIANIYDFVRAMGYIND